jgi:DNA ligase-1
MDAFAALIERLDGTPDEDSAARVLAQYLAQTPDPDRGYALAAIIGAVPRHKLSRAALVGLAEARLDPTLFTISKAMVGDVAETIALMWPVPAEPDRPAPSVAEAVAALDRSPSPVLTAQIARWLDSLAPSARVALLRLATGQLAAMALPVRAAQAALSRLGGASLREVEVLWHAASPPYAAHLAWADGSGPRPGAAVAPFRSMAAVRACSPSDHETLDLSAYAVDTAWDGLRVLAVVTGRTRRLYTRRGVSMGDRFPEILDALAVDGTFEGMLTMRDAHGRCSQLALELRMAPGRRPRAEAHAPCLMLHDALVHEGEEIAQFSLRLRRERLARLGNILPQERVALASLIPATDWLSVEALKTEARMRGAAGVILKPWDAPYGDEAGRKPHWIEVLCEPHTVSAVVLYIEWGAEATWATVGVWDNAALVPLAKVALSDPDTAAAVLDFAAETRVDRFGPVQQVAADTDRALVVEIAFAGVEGAPRRKSGVLLRDPHLLRVRPDAPPSEAARIADVRSLLS